MVQARDSRVICSNGEVESVHVCSSPIFKNIIMSFGQKDLNLENAIDTWLNSSLLGRHSSLHLPRCIRTA